MKPAAIIPAVLLLAVGGFFAVKYFNQDNSSEKLSDSSSVYNEITEIAEVTEAVTEEPFIPPVFVECTADDIHKGDLILVNRDYEYVNGSNTDIANIYSRKADVYDVNTVDMMLDVNMIDAINSMLGDFSELTGITNILANSGYRSYDEQKIMYDNDLAMTGKQYSTLVAPPGNSEHHTGYAMDFAINDGYSYPALRDEGEYSWIYENAHKYGMILRYTEQNSYITGYMAESWHFRYIGELHATLVSKMGISFEEYIGFIRNFSFEAPLEYKLSDDEFYRIYFVSADEENGVTEVPITYEAFCNQDDGYSVSGNNVDGFIVTLKTSELSDDYDESFLYMFGSPTGTDTAAPEEPSLDDTADDESGELYGTEDSSTDAVIY